MAAAASGGAAGAGAGGAGTVFGAGDLTGLITQLNIWAPQVEMQLQQVMGTAMVAEGRVQQAARRNSGTS